MSNLNQLELPDADEGEEQIPAFDTLPTQMGDFAEPIQPGPYLFGLPKGGPKYELIVDKEQKPRIKALFHDSSQLKIKDSVDRYRFTVDNIPYPRGADKIKVSKMTYLLAALKEHPKSASRKDMGDALDRACAKEMWFLGTTSLGAWCSTEKGIYLPDTLDEKGNVVKKGGKADKKGCGRRYSSNPYKPTTPPPNDPYGGEKFDIPKDPEDAGKYSLRFVCKCGALVRAYSNVDVFRSAD